MSCQYVSCVRVYECVLCCKCDAYVVQVSYVSGECGVSVVCVWCECVVSVVCVVSVLCML